MTRKINSQLIMHIRLANSALAIKSSLLHALWVHGIHSFPYECHKKDVLEKSMQEQVGNKSHSTNKQNCKTSVLVYDPELHSLAIAAI